MSTIIAPRVPEMLPCDGKPRYCVHPFPGPISYSEAYRQIMHVAKPWQLVRRLRNLNTMYRASAKDYIEVQQYLRRQAT